MADTFDILRTLVDEVDGPANWCFTIREEEGALRLVITIDGKNNYPPHAPFRVSHFHPVPVATYNERTWKRWIFEQCRRTMNHELGEQVRWGEDRPFAPLHGPGEDPYTVHEYRPLVDQFTTQSGAIREMPALPDHSSVLQDDLRDMLVALGMDDGARPQSPHQVFRECIEAVKQLRGGAAAQRALETHARA